MKKEYQDRIDDYLLDRMTEEERRAFENDIENNKELREQMKFTEMVQGALKSKVENNCMWGLLFRFSDINQWKHKQQIITH